MSCLVFIVTQCHLLMNISSHDFVLIVFNPVPPRKVDPGPREHIKVVKINDFQ